MAIVVGGSCADGSCSVEVVRVSVVQVAVVQIPGHIRLTATISDKYNAPSAKSDKCNSKSADVAVQQL